jgi:hypothetical protein
VVPARSPRDVATVAAQIEASPLRFAFPRQPSDGPARDAGGVRAADPDGLLQPLRIGRIVERETVRDTVPTGGGLYTQFFFYTFIRFSISALRKVFG